MCPKAADVFAKSARCPLWAKAADVERFIMIFLGESGRCTLRMKADDVRVLTIMILGREQPMYPKY